MPHSTRKTLKTVVLEAQNTWVPEVLKKLGMSLCVATIRRGEAITKRKKPIRKLLHTQIVTHSLKENASSGYEIKAVLNLLRLSVGRSGEVSTVNWGFAEWCQEDKVFTMNWPETKPGSKTTLSYGPDIY